MTWAKLPASNNVSLLPSAKAELYSLRSIDPMFAALSAYFDGCRTKRNVSEYTGAGSVTETEAEDLIKTVRQFAVDAEAWINANHPKLA